MNRFRQVMRRPWLAVVFLFALAVVQLVLLPHNHSGGRWFLYGRDTVTQDAVQLLWVGQWFKRDPLTIPLWVADVQGGIPTVGSFFWTPLSPFQWPAVVFPYPEGALVGWVLALWWAGLGGWALGKALRLRAEAALLVGTGWMLSGHVVTLIHAGHSQKVHALAWLAWWMAGLTMLADPRDRGRRLRGVVVAGAALGMMFLCGHPQIAYTALAMGVFHFIWMVDWPRKIAPRWTVRFAVYTSAAALGLLLAGAQFLPGMEMSALSNRAGGVPFDEATQTSYPPEELLELAIPRHKGTSVIGDIYKGSWGDERIVSDYAGKLVLLLACAGLLGMWLRYRHVVFWAVVALVSLIVGLGSYTPVYTVLYYGLPGFSSFRSPGTFMCAAALAFPVLAGYGLNAVLDHLRNRRRLAVLVAVLAVVVTAADLGWANRHFLHKWSWKDFHDGYLAPNELDLWLEDRGVALETHDVPGELRLRPILHGRPAINGYFPINYAFKHEQDAFLGYNTREWFAAWGVTHLLVMPGGEAAGGAEMAARFPEYGRDVLRLPGPGLVVNAEDNTTLPYEYLHRRPNDKLLRVQTPEQMDIQIAGMIGPGFRLYVNGEHVRTVDEPHVYTELRVPGGASEVRWIYRPDSWRLGLFFSVLAVLALAFLGAYGWLYRPPLRLHIVEESSPYPDYGGPLFDGPLEVIRHAHREVGEEDS